MIYSPRITKRLATVPSPEGNLQLTLKAATYQSGTWNLQLILGYRDDVKPTLTPGCVVPPIPLAFSDGTLRSIALSTLSDIEDILQSIFMCADITEKVVCYEAAFDTVVTTELPWDITTDAGQREMLNWVSKKLIDSHADEEVIQEYGLTFQISFCIANDLYQVLYCRAPELAMGGKAGDVIQERAYPQIESLFGSTRASLITLQTVYFSPQAGVDDDLDDNKWAHAAAKEDVVRASRALWMTKCGTEGMQESSKRLFTYSKTNVPSSVFAGMKFGSPSNPISPSGSQNYCATRWGMGIIDRLNDDAGRGYIRRFTYNPSHDDVSYSTLVANLADIEYMGGGAAYVLREAMREFEVLDSCFLYELMATKDIGCSLRTPSNLAIYELERYNQERPEHVWWSVKLGTGCRGFNIGIANIRDTDGAWKAVTQQAEAVGSSLAVDADFLAYNFTAGITSGSVSAWFEPYSRPTPSRIGGTILKSLAAGSKPEYSHGDNTDFFNYQYTQFYMCVDGSKGADVAFRCKDVPDVSPTVDGNGWYSYSGAMELEDLTIDLNGVASRPLVAGMKDIFAIGTAIYAPSASHGDPVIPARTCLILGADNKDDQSVGLVIDPDLWKGSEPSWWTDDEYTGYLLGRLY